MGILKALADLLAIDDARQDCDLIFVLAGRPERKIYGWELFRSGMAPRLIVSVGRYEVRAAAQKPVEIPELLALRDATPPAQRHFWVDLGSQNRSVLLARLRETNTYWELHGLAEYLGNQLPRRIAIVSTSIHLRRVRLCCRHIRSFSHTTLMFLPVPEHQSSFPRSGWWKHAGGIAYLLSEYAKLAAYGLIYGWK